VVIERGFIYWADLGPAIGSRPAKRRPVVVIQADSYNRSRLATVTVMVITSNTALSGMPGNVFLPAALTDLPRDSVANVTALMTLNRDELSGPIGRLPIDLLRAVDRGIRRALGV
jgi:mRNA interferase MazF